MNSTRDANDDPTAGATSRALRRTTKKLLSGRLRDDRSPSVLILAGCCGMVMAAIWAPVARAQLILSVAAIIAVWFRPPDK